MKNISRTDTTNRSGDPDLTDGVLRRTVLKAGAVAAVALGASGPVAARYSGRGNEPVVEDEPDSADEGFGVELLTGKTAFPDDVAATFRLKYDGGGGTIVSNLPHDASNVIFARVTWTPEASSGWHTHPGPVIVSVAEGELELVNERDCVVRTYSAGQAFVDPGQGNVHVARNPSTTDNAVAYATFLGVPDDAPATVWVPPVDCE